MTINLYLTTPNALSKIVFRTAIVKPDVASGVTHVFLKDDIFFDDSDKGVTHVLLLVFCLLVTLSSPPPTKLTITTPAFTLAAKSNKHLHIHFRL